MTSEEAFQQAGEYIESAADRMQVVLSRSMDMMEDWWADDIVEQLDLLQDAIRLTRRALSQAEGWLDHTRSRLEIEESEDDDTGAGEDREGQGPALRASEDG